MLKLFIGWINNIDYPYWLSKVSVFEYTFITWGRVKSVCILLYYLNNIFSSKKYGARVKCCCIEINVSLGILVDKYLNDKLSP